MHCRALFPPFLPRSRHAASLTPFPLFTAAVAIVSVAPMVWVQNQLEHVAVGRNISLHCNTESYPPSIHYWTHQNGSSISTGKNTVALERNGKNPDRSARKDPSTEC